MTGVSTQVKSRAVTSDDLDLVHASKNGDVAAFEQLVTKYDRRLIRVAQSITHNQEDSQDVVQEAFLKAYRHLAEFREASRFSTWLIRITVNEALIKLRKQRAVKESSLDDGFHADEDVLPREVIDWAPNPEQLYWASELREILAKALGRLPPIARAVFVLRDIEGLSLDQTAIAMNLSVSAVKARLWRVRVQLRKHLNSYFANRAETPKASESQ